MKTAEKLYTQGWVCVDFLHKQLIRERAYISLSSFPRPKSCFVIKLKAGAVFVYEKAPSGNLVSFRLWYHQQCHISSCFVCERKCVILWFILFRFISYPRTETNIFPKDLALGPLVEQQTRSPTWGTFAQRVLDQPGGPNPRQGKNSDQAHPPIHPTKYTNTLQVGPEMMECVSACVFKEMGTPTLEQTIVLMHMHICFFQGNEGRLYEFIVRHFLACVSQDALGQETVVDIDIAEEKFSASGLMIIARNYLDIYPYDRWSTKVGVQMALSSTWKLALVFRI